MRTIIAGSRTITDYARVHYAVEQSGFDITSVLSGKAAGVDTLGEKWAKLNNVPVAEYKADWKRHGKAAGPIRNSKMVENCDALIAVWDGVSTGTADMINKAKRLGKFVHVHRIETIMWMPAASAPRDGSIFMGMIFYSPDHYEILEVHWDEEDYNWVHSGELFAEFSYWTPRPLSPPYRKEDIIIYDY